MNEKLYDRLFELNSELREVQKELRAQRECFAEINKQIEQLFNMIVDIQTLCENDVTMRPVYQNKNVYER
jgi:peptidoglycan hydrolase CwlO-like protein